MYATETTMLLKPTLKTITPIFFLIILFTPIIEPVYKNFRIDTFSDNEIKTESITSTSNPQAHEPDTKGGTNSAVPPATPSPSEMIGGYIKSRTCHPSSYPGATGLSPKAIISPATLTKNPIVY
jgi:hypothetical protein